MPRDAAVVTESLYLPMRDGTRIAVDVMRPASAKPGAAMPTVMTLTRYWRSFALRTPAPTGAAPIGPRDPIADDLVARGFVVLIADARGTGASEGVWPHPWSNLEIEDMRDIVDWIVAQPWSNGRVGATGLSYEGTTAMLLASLGHPAVKVVAARSFEFDLYTDIIAPGGIFNDGPMRFWSDSVADLDANRPPKLFGPSRFLIKGVRPVDSDPKGEKVARIVETRNNPPVYEAVSGIKYRDDPYDGQDVTLDDLSAMSRLGPLRDASVPTQIWASWLDGTTAASALRFFDELPSVRDVRIGAWSHTGAQHGSPMSHRGEPMPPLKEQWGSIAMFLGERLFDAGPSENDERLVHYFTMGEEQWHATPVWPPEHVRPVTWHLTPNSALSKDPVEERTVRHSFDAVTGSGMNNRWYTQLARPVRYGDRAREDHRLAVWDSPALVRGIEVSGSPAVYLRLRASVRDVALFAYLEAIDLDGYVHYVTEGELRACHRSSDPGERPSFLRADSSSLLPGEVADVAIDLLPTSIYLPAGWQVRLAIAAADAPTFARIEADGSPEIEVVCGGESGSIFVLPTG